MNEQLEINHLLSKGFEIKTFLFGKQIVWKTKKMTLGRLIELSNVYLKMKIDDSVFDKENIKDIISEQYQAVNKNGKNCAKIIAISVTDIKWLRPLLVRHFLRNISAAELLEIAKKLLAQGDYSNFILSIGLMNGNRITKPNQIEKTPA